VFLRGIRDIRDDALSPHIICGSFRKRGIYPFNPDLVVKPLSDREEREFIPLRGFDIVDSAEARGAPDISSAQERLSPAPSSSSIELPNTPRSLRKSFKKIRPYLATDEKLHRRIKRMSALLLSNMRRVSSRTILSPNSKQSKPDTPPLARAGAKSAKPMRLLLEMRGQK
jgi:hypothetical protein